MAVTTGTAASVISTAPLPNQSGILVPGVQAQDGSFVGSYKDNSGQTDMVAFDASGNIRWTVPNETPLLATTDGGVIGQSGTTYYANGSATGQLAVVPTESWRGNNYEIGLVDQIVSGLIHKAQSLWAQLGGSPSGNSTAGRPWYFRLVWENSCSGTPQPCGFYLYPFNPQYLPTILVNATSQAACIKASALAALKKAFSSYPVNISVEVAEGSPDTGDHRANVVNGSEIDPITHLPVCGGTATAGTTNSNVYYQQNMEFAQDAVPVTLRTEQDAQNALTNMFLMTAIGAGIGNTAAHEIGHQFFGTTGHGMEDTSTNTYNSKFGCDPGAVGSGRWNYGFGPISWEPVTASAWESVLQGGFHK